MCQPFPQRACGAAEGPRAAGRLSVTGAALCAWAALAGGPAPGALGHDGRRAAGQDAARRGTPGGPGLRRWRAGPAVARWPGRRRAPASARVLWPRAGVRPPRVPRLLARHAPGTGAAERSRRPSTSRTSAPANAPPAGRKPANAATSPHASSKDNASWDGAKQSTNSTSPTQDESDIRHIRADLKDPYTPEVTSSPTLGKELHDRRRGGRGAGPR